MFDQYFYLKEGNLFQENCEIWINKKNENFKRSLDGK